MVCAQDVDRGGSDSHLYIVPILRSALSPQRQSCSNCNMGKWAVPGTSSTLTVFQNRLRAARCDDNVPGTPLLCWSVLARSCRRLMRSRSCEGPGRGTRGGGPAAVDGSGVASLLAVACRHRLDSARRRQKRWKDSTALRPESATCRVLMTGASSRLRNGLEFYDGRIHILPANEEAI